MDLDRRQLLAGLAAVATVRWTRDRALLDAPPRVRAGGIIDLRHPLATGFRLETPGRPTVEVPAPEGRLRVRAPEGAPGFATVRCTPLSGRRVEPAVDVAVYTVRLSYGA